MNYEAWRISYQSSEQAARAAFKAWQEVTENKIGYEVGEVCEIDGSNYISMSQEILDSLNPGAKFYISKSEPVK